MPRRPFDREPIVVGVRQRKQAARGRGGAERILNAHHGIRTHVAVLCSQANLCEP